MKPWARYDRDFEDDLHVAAMPARHRAAAYLLLLALNGKCRRPAAPTGRLLAAEVEVSAQKLGVKSRTLLPVLEQAGLVELDGRDVVLPRFFEWNPELRPAAAAARSAAARIAATVRWASEQDATTHAEPDATAHAPTDALPDALPDASDHASSYASSDARYKREKKDVVSSETSPSERKGLENNSVAREPFQRTTLPVGPDPQLTEHAQVVIAAWEELVGRAASGEDQDTAHAWLTEMQRATGHDLATWIREAQEHNRSTNSRTPAKTLRALASAVKGRYRHEVDNLSPRSSHTRQQANGLVSVGATIREEDPDDVPS